MNARKVLQAYYVLIILSAAMQDKLILSQESPTEYYSLKAFNLRADIVKIGYSPNQQLMIALSNRGGFYVYHGITYLEMDTINTGSNSIFSSFAFAPDNSFLIVG
jgi:hypothetical protein